MEFFFLSCHFQIVLHFYKIVQSIISSQFLQEVCSSDNFGGTACTKQSIVCSMSDGQFLLNFTAVDTII